MSRFVVTVFLSLLAASNSLADPPDLSYVEPSQDRFVVLGTGHLLSDEPPVDVEIPLPLGPLPRFVQIRYGSPDSVRVCLAVTDSPEGKRLLYADRNRDRILELTERIPEREPGVWEFSLECIPDDTLDIQPVKRVVRARIGRSGWLLSLTTLGHLEGVARLGDREIPCLRFDGDANGFFHDRDDRIRLDLDGDGEFSLLDEQFLAAPILRIEGQRHVVHSDRLGLSLSLAPLQGTGTLTVELNQERAKVKSLHLVLVTREGSTYSLTSATGGVELPVGEYRIDTLSVGFEDPSGGEDWNYMFSANRIEDSRWIRVRRDEQVAIDPIGKLDFAFEARPVRNDDTRLSIRPYLMTEDGLLINFCARGERRGFRNMTSPLARTTLATPEGETVDETTSGFA